MLQSSCVLFQGISHTDTDRAQWHLELSALCKSSWGTRATETHLTWVCRLSVVFYFFYKREDNWKKKFGIFELLWSRGKWHSPRGRQYRDGEGAQRQGQPRHCKVTLAYPEVTKGRTEPQATLWGTSRSPPSPVSWPGLGVGAEGCWAEPCCRPIAQRCSSLIT